MLAARGAEAQMTTRGAGGFMVSGAAPTLDLNFMVPGTLPPNVTFTRTTVGTYIDAAGVMQTAAINTPRWDYDPVSSQLRGLLVEEPRTNSIKNSTMVGAVAGSPGTDPTGWVFSQGSTGLTRQIAGVGVENGITYIDVRYTGASAASGNMTIQFGANGTSGIPAAAAQQWVLSYYITLSGGTLPPFTGPLFRCNQWDSGGGLLGVLNTPGAVPIVQPLKNSRTVSNFPVTIANTAFLTPFWLIGMSGSASPVDFTIRVGAPQLELGAFATSFIPTSTVAVARTLDTALYPAAPLNANTGSMAVDVYLRQLLSVTSINVEMLSIDAGSGSDIMTLRATGLPPSSQTAIFVANANQTQPGMTTGPVSLGLNKLAMSYSRDTTNAVTNVVGASVVGTGNPPSLPTPTRMTFGTGRNSPINGTIQRARYWPRVLPDWELSRVTT